MTNTQAAKARVRAFHTALDAVSPDEIEATLAAHCAPDLIWRGYHPFNEMRGPRAVSQHFWGPLKTAPRSLQRREDIFFAGTNQIDNSTSIWVVSMGHLMGLLDGDFVGIPATGKIAMLRYATFHKVENDRITETAMYFDLPHLMAQTGRSPFKHQTAQHLVQPGPMTHQGLLHDPQKPAEGQATLDVINRMIADLGQWQSGLPLEDELALTWHPDMVWWGPEGVGSSYTIERYAKQHSGPFRAAFSERSKTTHIARLAEGHFGGFFGWPNFTAKLTGPFMGLPPTGKTGEFRVIDIYRRDGDKLAETWVFIDLLHFLKSPGVDVLAGDTL